MSVVNKHELLQNLLWPDAFADFEAEPAPASTPWHFDHAFLETVYRHCPQPQLLVEVGSWLGRSAIEACLFYTSQLGWREFTLICVDTWLGSTEHWLRPQSVAVLQPHNGYPQIYQQFLSQVALAGVSDYVLPLPQTSANGAHLIEALQLQPDWVYLDASHYTSDVLLDMDLYWPLIRPGGVLFGDDWNWPSVRQAVQEYCEIYGLAYQHSYYSWAIFKAD